MLTEYALHPTFATSDAERAKAWFRDKLGLEPEQEWPGVLYYTAGSSAFSLYETPNAGTAKNTVAAWNATDVRAEMERLKGRGVVFEDYDFGDFKTVDGLATDPEGNVTAWFKDADGNIHTVISVPELGDYQVSAMLAASDLPRAKAWYADKLGYQPMREIGDEVAVYRSGPGSFSVYRSDFAGTAKNTVAGWRVPDLRTEVEALTARGVALDRRCRFSSTAPRNG